MFDVKNRLAECLEIGKFPDKQLTVDALAYIRFMESRLEIATAIARAYRKLRVTPAKDQTNEHD